MNKEYIKGVVYRILGYVDNKTTGDYCDLLCLSESGLTKVIHQTGIWEKGRKLGSNLDISDARSVHLIANTIEEYHAMEDYKPQVLEKVVEKEVIKKVYRDRVVHRHTYTEKYNETPIDRMYIKYCEMKGRDFEKEYTEEKIMEV